MAAFGRLEPVEPLNEERNPLLTILLVGVIGLGLWLRFAKLSSDLWFDEITLIQKAKSFGNYSLYSVLLNYLGEHPSSFVYRLPSFILSTFLLLALIYFAIKRDKFEQFCFTVFFSCSYVFVLYGSEVSEYVPALFFTLFSLAALRITIEDGGPFSLSLFFVSSILAFFFHPSYLLVYLAFIIWSLVAWCIEDGFSSAVLKTFVVHTIPSVVFGIFTFKNYSGVHLPYSSQTLQTYFDNICDALSVAFGGPLLAGVPHEATETVQICVVLAIFIMNLEIAFLFSQKRAAWALFFFGVFLIPLATLVLLKPKELHFHQFIFPIFLAYLLMASFLNRLWKSSFFGKVFALLLLFGFCFGNAALLKRYLAYGRGSYQSALQYMISKSVNGKVTLGSDDDSFNLPVIDYYKAELGLGEKIHYINSSELKDLGPEWYLTHSPDAYATPRTELTIGNNKYQLRQIYPSADVSGWTWALYLKEEASPVAPAK